MKKIAICTMATLLLMNVPALAKTQLLQDLTNTPETQGMFVKANNKTIVSPTHWTYKTLEHISKKYGLVLGDPSEKFDMNKPLTRNEAAVMLVSLVGKVRNDNLQLTDIEKDRISILKEEFGPELQDLTGRVSMLEKDVKSLSGEVSELKEAKNISFGFGEKLKITGGMQARYTGIINQGDTKYPANFRIPVSNLALKGKINKNLHYVANWQPSRYYDGGKKTMMADCYLMTDYFKNHNIYIGQTRVPIGIEGTTSDFKLATVSRAQIGRAYSGTRDIGVKVIGRYKYLDYFAGAYNGDRYESTDSNKSLDVSGWVTLKPFADFELLKNFEIGSGYTSGKEANSFDVWGGYVGYKIGKLGLQYEASVADGGYGAVNQRSYGWYTQATYDLTDKLQLVGKVDQFDPNRAVGKDDISEYTLGANYFFNEQKIKLMANYVYVNNTNARNHSRIVSQIQYLF